MAIDPIDLISWREAAACLGSDVSFFPSPEDVRGIAKAKSICATCPVEDDCLAYAIATNQSEGIWGATTPKERAKLRRRWLQGVRQAS